MLNLHGCEATDFMISSIPHTTEPHKVWLQGYQRTSQPSPTNIDARASYDP
jgi:hypothetical protein